MSLGIEKEILRLDIAMGYTLTVKIRDALEHLLEAALDFSRAHTTAKAIKLETDQTNWQEPRGAQEISDDNSHG